jgi:hypothetical protein
MEPVDSPKQQASVVTVCGMVGGALLVAPNF